MLSLADHLVSTYLSTFSLAAQELIAARFSGGAIPMLVAFPPGAAIISPVLGIVAAALSNVAAARSFNRGLRSIYFGLTSVAWLAGPIALLLATTFTIAVIWRREFASQSRTVLLGTQT